MTTDYMENKTMTTFTTQDRQDAQRTPLTADEIVDLWFGIMATYSTAERQIAFARAIERAHGIGE